jgi:hypothetical protein
MKRIVWFILIVVLMLPALTHCGPPEQVDPAVFDALARWIPNEAQQAFFLNFKPDGEAGRHWQHIRQQIEATPAGQEALAGMLGEFRVEDYNLYEFMEGPAVSSYQRGGGYVIAQVNDEDGAANALRERFADAAWEEEDFDGQILYHATNPDPWRERERLAWTIHDGMLFLVVVYDSEPLPRLQTLLSLPQQDSLAALPSWETLLGRLPADPMGLIFINPAEQASQDPAYDTSPGAVLVQELEATAIAAVPEEKGMRVEVVGTFQEGASSIPELRALFDLPPLDPAAWTALPGNTAIALFAHDTSIVWPFLKEAFGLGGMEQVRDVTNLDLEADLFSADGPLTGDLALAITPPLPDQPVSKGLAAAQLLLLTQDASKTQVAKVRMAMVGRGAVFGPDEVENVYLQTQVGTGPSGYAISFGFDDDTLYFGSSPDIIGQALVAQREDSGLITTDPFETVLEALPGKPQFAVYLDSESLSKLAWANMTEQEYERSGLQMTEVFEAMGLGLQLEPDRLDGTIYFLIRE